MFETGIIDPSDLQKYLENRNVGCQRATDVSYVPYWP